ncbi:MAG: xanthine dehydrogenase YagT iron-sulfur-binding subunit [Mycobacterium sp.]|nr:xanthine dehydrogenase YagT iron-sulfur-binding subunit [Mycobacterium sp.]
MDKPNDDGPDEHLAAAFRVNRRTFVGASVTVGGAVAVGSLLAGCDDAEPVAGEDTKTTVSLRINGEAHELTVDNRTSLLDLLRERVGLTGTKKGCDQGACGACTILMDDTRVTSCLTLAAMHDGADIVTIEGLAANGRLHPLQQAFIDEDAFQCGYCTPGQILSGVGCIKEGHTGSAAEIREWMSGNICRCGAYTNIVTAIAKTSNGA